MRCSGTRSLIRESSILPCRSIAEDGTPREGGAGEVFYRRTVYLLQLGKYLVPRHHAVSAVRRYSEINRGAGFEAAIGATRYRIGVVRHYQLIPLATV